MHRKLSALVLSGLISVSVVGCGNSEVEELQNKVIKLEQENKTLETSNKELKTENTQLEIKNKQLEGKVEEASPWFEMKEEERKAEEERLAKEKAEKEEAERKAKEEAEAKAKAEQEAKEKQGFDTGITYNQLARTPDDYMGKKCKSKGEVIQVMEDSDLVVMRLAVNGNYDNILFLTATEDILSEGRILENDYITVYGTSTGIYTYTSTMGASISIPSIFINRLC